MAANDILDLSEKEVEVLYYINKAGEVFAALENQTPPEIGDFNAGLRAAQSVLLARPTVRFLEQQQKEAAQKATIVTPNNTVLTP